MSGEPRFGGNKDVGVAVIDAYPVGPDNYAIPASIRRSMRYHPGGQPTKLLATRIKVTPSGFVHVFVRYACRPKPLFSNPNAPTVDWGCCAVFTQRDATDPLFDSLTEHERMRILRAVKRMGSSQRGKAMEKIG